MTAPTAFLARSDAITRARRAFWRGLFLGIALSGAVLFAAALFAAYP